MKRGAVILIGILVLAAVGWFIGSGLIERTDVFLEDYSVSEDGKEIRLKVGVSGSMGYTRGFRSKGGGGIKPYYLKFYSGFGGFNSRLGAKNEFTLKLEPGDREIYFNSSEGGYKLVLYKDEISGEWKRSEDKAREDKAREEEEREEEILEKQIAEKLASMTLEEKVSQLFIITPEALTGEVNVTEAGAETKTALTKYSVGGLIYFPENIVSEEQIKEMTANQQRYAEEQIGLPLFISTDEEGGTVTRVAGNENFAVSQVGDMCEVGETKDTGKAYEVGDTIGSYLSQLGLNLDFAPVADVLTNPENTVVKKRSFGNEAELVSEMVIKELTGMQQHMVYGCVKHFPGHGATLGDTHNGYAYTDKTWEELKKNEIIPFQKAIEAGVSFVMVGHISTPQATGDDVPASCSPKMIGEYLRNELGYDGIVITDALNMKAVTDQYASDEAAVRVLQAGGDMLLMPEDFEAAYRGVITAVQEGKITETRLDESLKRILRIKLKMLQEKNE